MGNGASASEVGSGIGKGLASLVGLGEYVSGDQISNLNNTLSDSKDELTKYFQNATLAALEQEQIEIQKVVQWTQTQNNMLSLSMDLQNTILTSSMQKENMFTALLGILILIIIFFMIIKKKCC
jgi:predicted PurR-regulated permease PerM